MPSAFLSFQDFDIARQEGALINFIPKAIENHLASELYLNAIESEKYFMGENPRLARYSAVMQVEDRAVELFPRIRVPSGIFRRHITLLVNRLWYNGVQLDTPEQKLKLGKYFDKIAMSAHINAAIHSVAYGFWNYDHLQAFTVKEYFPLVDEGSSMHMAGIRFWQIAEDKPKIIELYELDGMTKFKQVGNGPLEIMIPKRAYRLTVRDYSAAGLGIDVIDGENYPGFPVVPIYSNERHISELTPPVKAKIDVYDVLTTSFLDDAIKTKAIYWLLSGMSGNEEYLMSVKNAIQRLGIIAPNDPNVNAEAATVTLSLDKIILTLDWIKKEIHSDMIVMDPNEITARSITNVAIQTNSYAMDTKTSEMDWQASLFTQQILNLAGIDSKTIVFKQKTISNDLEISQRLAMYPDVDLETKLRLDPLFPDDDIPAILDRVALDQLSVNPNEPVSPEPAQPIDQSQQPGAAA